MFAEAQASPGVDAPGPSSAIELDWREVDPSLSQLVTGERVRLGYDEQQPWIGAEQPLVTVVLYVDYECPVCPRLDARIQDALAGDGDGLLRVVYRVFPLSNHHPRAVPAARAALAAHAQGQFEAMHAKLMANTGALEDDDLRGYAASLGLDMARFEHDFGEGVFDQRIAADMALAESIGLIGVPTAYINGRLLEQDDALMDMIAQERRVAEELIAAGAPRSEVWARILAASAEPSPQ